MVKLKSSKNSRVNPIKKKRLLFFDIIRILCIAAIVYDHSRYDLIQGFNLFFFSDG